MKSELGVSLLSVTIQKVNLPAALAKARAAAMTRDLEIGLAVKTASAEQAAASAAACAASEVAEERARSAAATAKIQVRQLLMRCRDISALDSRAVRARVWVNVLTSVYDMSCITVHTKTKPCSHRGSVLVVVALGSSSSDR